MHAGYFSHSTNMTDHDAAVIDIQPDPGRTAADHDLEKTRRSAETSLSPEGSAEIPTSGENTPILSSPRWRLARSFSANSYSRFDAAVPTNKDSERNRRTLGVFSGVFAPVALSMFSTMLFLRPGFVVAQAGILQTVILYSLAYFILIMTILSICAISTNGAVEGGGAYYMISRALGPEFGGSIGFLFFIANVFSCALYVTGFVEGMLVNFGIEGKFVSEGNGLPEDSRWWLYLYATVVLLVCLLVCIIGGAMFARTLVFIFLLVVICVLSVYLSMFIKSSTMEIAIPFTNTLAYTPPINDSVHLCSNKSNTLCGNYTGLETGTIHNNLYESYAVDYKTLTQMTFASVFAILFSSVTGIMNGANMSGELKDPGYSIPRGTLSASVFTLAVYLILSFFIAASCDRYLLGNNYLFLQDINIWPPFVVIGVFSTTLSAALGNLIGASRIVEALGNDQLFWMLLKPATITTKGGNPYVAVIISWFLAQLVLLIGSLNTIAPLVSVFFLLSYASTNLACLALELASAPNFRPTFRYFGWHTCTLGLIGSLVMCFLISALYASIAIIILLLLIIVLHFQSVPSSWGSISQALIFHQVRKYLLMLDNRKDHVKYWRLQVLLLVANPRHCCQVMDFINDIKKGGLYVIGHVKLTSLESCETDPLLEDYNTWLSLVDHLKVKAFVELTTASSVADGMQHLVRISGLGGMKPNTVCLGFYDDIAPLDSLMRTRKRKKLFFGATEQDVYKHIEDNLPHVRIDEKDRLLDGHEFVQLIAQALKLQKNVLLCRGFEQLDKSAISASAKGGASLYIDVWPVNLFFPDKAGYFDKTCLFILQLACILNMVPWWKGKTILRVLLCIDANADDTLYKERKLDEFLQKLRITAQIKMVNWQSCLNHLQNSDETESDRESAAAAAASSQPNGHYSSRPDVYIESVNELIVSNSKQTAVTFLYLPQPPVFAENYTNYLYELTKLSADLPPTVLVHGLHPVTSTTL